MSIGFILGGAMAIAPAGMSSAPGTISVGVNHRCGVDAQHRIQCSGSNAFAQLGTGTPPDNGAAAVVDVDATGVSAGGLHTCAVDATNGVVCWGSNALRQLGVSTLPGEAGDASGIPVKAELNAPFVAVSVAAGFSSSCAISDLGRMQCWGANDYGQLGNGGTSDSSLAKPVALGAGEAAAQVGIGYYHTCALLTDGSVRCWGVNADQELGASSLAQSAVPVLIDVPPATHLAVGGYHACVIGEDGVIRCWGLNNLGQAGAVGPASVKIPAVVALPEGRAAVAIAAAAFSTCAIADDGAIFCWGSDELGQLGGGEFSPPPSATAQPVPQQVTLELAPGEPGPDRIDGGGQTYCASGERIWCWGLINENNLTWHVQATPQPFAWNVILATGFDPG